MNHLPLLSYRDCFPILAKTNYLISNSLGAVPQAVSESLQSYYETWASRGVRAWEEGWWDLAESLGDLVAPLIGASGGEVVFQPNVTISHAVLFSAFDFRLGRSKIVTDAMHFPSILYLIDQQRALGAEIVVVASQDGIGVDVNRLMEEIDETTAFVSISHVLFKSAYVQNIAAIAERARKVGAITIIDGYQSVGVIPVDVRSLGVDCYIGGCLKWLCGGPGAAFLWVDPILRTSLAPRLTGWMAHEHPFHFDPAFRRRTDVRRFLHGTPNISGLLAARPGLEIVNEIGVDSIREKSTKQTKRLMDLALSRGYVCNTPIDPDRRGGTVSLGVPHGYEVSKALKARDILCDFRPGAGVRLSPHFYNRDDEIDSAVAAIGEILESGDWKAFENLKSTVT